MCSFQKKECPYCSTSQPICRIMGIENVLALVGPMTFEKMTPRLSPVFSYKEIYEPSPLFSFFSPHTSPEAAITKLLFDTKTFPIALHCIYSLEPFLGRKLSLWDFINPLEFSR